MRYVRSSLATLLVALLALGVLPGTCAAAGRNLKAGGTEPYRVRRTDERWTMADGVKLPVSVYSPVPSFLGEKFPMVVFTHGWMLNKSMFDPVAKRYASRGYVGVTYTVRGWGGAEGVIGCVGPDCEMKDLSRIITLTSEDRRFPVLKDALGPVVGSTGYSLGGLTSFLIAPRRGARQGDPGDPRIRAIVPMHGATDLLFSLMPNGVGKAFWVLMLVAGSYFGNLSAMATNLMQILADTATSPFEKLLSALNTLTLLFTPINRVSGEFTRIVGIALQRRVGEMDQLRSFVDRRSARWWCDRERDGVIESPITVPTLMTTSWSDDLFNANEALWAFDSLVDAPKRIIIGSGGHAGGYRMQFPGIQPQPDPEQEYMEKEAEAWFDHFLKGMDNGVEREPAVSYYRPWDRGDFGTSSVWPPAGTRDMTLYPGPSTGFREGSLSTSPAAGSPPDLLLNTGFCGSVSLPYFNDMPKMAGVNQEIDIPEKTDLVGMPFQRYSYLTAPYPRDLVILGTPRMAFTYQSSGNFAQLIPRLYEVAPDGTQTLISRGWFEGYSGRTGTRLDGGCFEMMSTCYRVRAGSRLKLEVQTSDLLQSWPLWGFFMLNVFHDGAGATRIVLPVASG